MPFVFLSFLFCLFLPSRIYFFSLLFLLILYVFFIKFRRSGSKKLLLVLDFHRLPVVYLVNYVFYILVGFFALIFVFFSADISIDLLLDQLLFSSSSLFVFIPGLFLLNSPSSDFSRLRFGLLFIVSVYAFLCIVNVFLPFYPFIQSLNTSLGFPRIMGLSTMAPSPVSLLFCISSLLLIKDKSFHVLFKFFASPVLLVAAFLTLSKSILPLVFYCYIYYLYFSLSMLFKRFKGFSVIVFPKILIAILLLVIGFPFVDMFFSFLAANSLEGSIFSRISQWTYYLDDLDSSYFGTFLGGGLSYARSLGGQQAHSFFVTSYIELGLFSAVFIPMSLYLIYRLPRDLGLGVLHGTVLSACIFADCFFNDLLYSRLFVYLFFLFVPLFSRFNPRLLSNSSP